MLYQLLSEKNAILIFVSDIFIETTGFTFTLPLFKILGGCKVGCYVHYPLITKEMLGRVQDRRNIYNNRNFISQSITLTHTKLCYYHALTWVSSFYPILITYGTIFNLYMPRGTLLFCLHLHLSFFTSKNMF